jgi:hypothetical protein
MQIGQYVRIITVPESAVDTPGFPTRSILIQCVGKVFPIMDFQGELLAIDVGEITGKASYLETIYIEPASVEEVPAVRKPRSGLPLAKRGSR